MGRTPRRASHRRREMRARDATTPLRAMTNADDARTPTPLRGALKKGGLSKSRVVVESDGFTYKKRKSTKGVVGVTIAEPLWNGRGKDARALVRVNASNASAMSSGEARGREDFHEKLPNDMPEDEACNCCARACARRS